MSENGGRYCNQCGDCCRHFLMKIPLKKGERMPGMILFWNLHENIEAQVVEFEDGKREIHVHIRNKCSMLVEHPDGTTSCKLYYMRPYICRSFPLSHDAKRHRDLPRCTMLAPADDESEALTVESPGAGDGTGPGGEVPVEEQSASGVI